jgi:hypothetical protein
MGRSAGSVLPANGWWTFKPCFSKCWCQKAQRRGVQRVGLVLENGPTPAPKQLEGWVQAQAQEQDGGQTFQVDWLPTNARLAGSVGNLVQRVARQAPSAHSSAG